MGVKSKRVPRACDKNLIQDNQYNEKKETPKENILNN